MMMRVTAFVCALALAGFGAPARAQAPAEQPTTQAPAAAPAKPAKAKRKTKAARTAKGETPMRGGALLIVNQRDATLVELTATPKGRKGESQVIASDVAAGGEAKGRLDRKAGCLFDLSGTFSDESTMEASGLDLCKDGRIKLVE